MFLKGEKICYADEKPTFQKGAFATFKGLKQDLRGERRI